MFVANTLKNEHETPLIDEYRESFVDLVFQMVEKFIADKPLFSIDDFSVIYNDEFSMGTACHRDIFSTMYLQINNPSNYKLHKISKAKKLDKKIEIPELYTSLEDIKKGLFECLVSHLDGNNLVWVEKNCVCVKATVYDNDIGIMPYYLRIIPCLTYYNKNNVRGIMYFYGKDIDIEYPDLALENYHHKNDLTDDLYRQMVLIFKNILLKEKDIERLPSEIIETVLYNVPTEMFIDDSYSTILNILNYLRNKNIKDFVTLDEEDNAFVSVYRSMSMYYVKHILKIIERYLERAK